MYDHGTNVGSGGRWQVLCMEYGGCCIVGV